MDNYDKLYKHYQQAAKNDEAKGFPAMEKVWTRLEDKLDAKVHKKQSKAWKKIAIAASFLFIISLGYQLFKPTDSINKQNQIIHQPNETAAGDTVKTIAPQVIPQKEAIEKAIVTSTKRSPAIREDAHDILNKQLKDQEPIGYQTETKAETMTDAIILTDSAAYNFSTKKAVAKKEKSSSAFLNRPVYDAQSVQHPDKDKGYLNPDSFTAKSVQTKSEPLIVIDGEVIKAKEGQSYMEAIRLGKTEFKSEDMESLVVLPDPLYIINGIHYSEESLFGKNPTSPYAPLSKQEIESISILQGKEAIAVYGEKGAKGVVIISTKNGKPSKK